MAVDAGDHEGLVEFLGPIRTLLSAVPWYMHPQVARACIEAGSHMIDLGGNTDVCREVLASHQAAVEAGVTFIPDCGLAPGLVNTLAVYGIDQLDECDEVQMRCGGLPQNPRPPLDYKLVFAISGVTVEYCGKALVIREGEIVEVDTFSELEEIDLPAPLGRCEAFVTSGGSSTAPFSFKGKVKNYEYKTIRYPGHYAKFKVIKELGLLELEPVCVGDNLVVPRDVFHRVAGPRLDFPEDKDLVVVRVTCRGKKSGRDTQLQFDILDYHDDATGFGAMERTTGFPAAIVAQMVADGLIAPGAHPLEKAIPGKPFVDELVRRGIRLKETVTQERTSSQ
jgi:lysine 6-dehydrogenase